MEQEDKKYLLGVEMQAQQANHLLNIGVERKDQHVLLFDKPHLIYAFQSGKASEQ